jgi:two-component system response regulator (stage 0 sporulation protein A)
MDDIEKSLDLEMEITKLLSQMGFPTHIKGYIYLRKIILLAINDDMNDTIMKMLYLNVAKEYRTTSSRVERAICHAIDVAWARGDDVSHNSYFGCMIKPTNTQFIKKISEDFRSKNKL